MIRYVLFHLFICLAASSPLKNITITVPDGTSTHGNADLLCTPTRWTDIVIFFLGNYVAHAATAISLPGERWEVVAVTAIVALLLPTSGIFRGLMKIGSFAKFGKSDLHTAARAGALCMVVRSSAWMPAAGDEAQYAICRVPSSTNPYKMYRFPWCMRREQNESSSFEGESQDISNFVSTNSIDSIGPKKQVIIKVFEDPWVERIHEALTRHIHGSHKLPPGYSFAVVPASAEFESDTDSVKDITISSNYNLVKILVSGGQSIFSSITLYRSRGDQIDRYGFAAFGLTVAPYALMAIVNLLASMMVPSYPTMYLIGSSISDEAKRRHGCHLDGLVGRLVEREDDFSCIRSRNTHFFCIRDRVHFEKTSEENTEIFSDAEDTDSESCVKVSFKTSMDQYLILPSVHMKSTSQSEPNDLVELQPSKVSFCLSVKKTNPISIKWIYGLRAARKRLLEIKRPFTQSLQAFRLRFFKEIMISIRRMVGNDSKVANLDDVIIFVPNSPMLKNTAKIPGKAIPYDVALRADDNQGQNQVEFQRTGAFEMYEHPVLWFCVFATGLVPLAIVGALSGFKRRSATLAQEVWTMIWLVYGSIAGTWVMAFLGFVTTYCSKRLIEATKWMEDFNGSQRFWALLYIFLSLASLLAVPSIGGFVVVGQMLAAYGTCYRFI